MKAYVEPEEITLMEQAASNLRDKILIHLLFHLGCRISEALSLRVDDIDSAQGTVAIIHLKRRLKLSCPLCGARFGADHLFCPKCGGRIEKSQVEEQEHRRQRVLPIDSDTLKLLYIAYSKPLLVKNKINLSDYFLMEKILSMMSILSIYYMESMKTKFY